jgi:hypothetical protein
MRRRPSASFALLSALAVLGAHACTPSSQTNGTWGGGGSTWTATGTGGETWFDAGSSGGPPPVDAGGVCGNEVHKIAVDPPNVYFVIDASGSMSTPFGSSSRYRVVQSAASKIVTQLRSFIKVGAAVFPGPNDDCAQGVEVFPLTFGDPVGFDKATAGVSPNGGTPTAATLAGLLPKLKALPGRTVVVLATDGGPNCNPLASCDKSECMENIEGCLPGDSCCAAGQNCCSVLGSAGPLNCVDHQPAVDAVKALADAGIRVFVIGIPGSEAYESVLRDMALQGGAAVAAYPFYYKVTNTGGLGTVLGAAAGSGISCDIKLEGAPATPDLTNVYFDQSVVLSDAVDGWTWTAADQITLHGASCAKLHSGLVGQVQIVSGCPTEGPK